MADPGGNPAEMLGAFRKGLTGLAASFNIVTGAVKQFGSVLGEFVGLFSPVAVQQFNFAVRDMMAAIGEALTPVMNAAIPVVRFLGDVFAGIARQIQPLISGGLNVVGELFQVLSGAIQQLIGQALAIMIPVWQTMVGVFQGLIPVLMPIINLIVQVAGVMLRFQAGVLNLVLVPLRLMGTVLGPIFELLSAALQPLLEGFTMLMDVFGAVTGIIGELASGLGELIGDMLKGVFRIFIESLTMVTQMVRDFANWVRNLLGIADKDKSLEMGDSRGKAVVSTGQTSVAGLLSKMQTSAFALGGANPQLETAKNTAKANDLLAGLAVKMGELGTNIKDGIRDGVRDALVAVANKLAPPNPIDLIANLIP